MRCGRRAMPRLATGNVATLRQLAADKYYGNIVTEVQPTHDADRARAARRRLDLAELSTIIPDEFMGKGDPSILTKDVFKILKPGGTFMIIDHMAEAGARACATPTRFHRDRAGQPCASIVEAAGFKFAGESKVLEQSRRSARHPGVRQVDPRPHQPVRLQVRQAAAKRARAPCWPLRRRRATRASPRDSCSAPSSRASPVGQSRLIDQLAVGPQLGRALQPLDIGEQPGEVGEAAVGEGHHRALARRRRAWRCTPCGN